MRHIAIVVAAISIAAPLSAQQVNPEVFTLDNGMKFLLLPRTDQPNVIAAGWVAKVGSVKPHKKFKSEIYVLSKEEGGRHTPFFSNYRPQFYFRTTDVTGSIQLPEGVEMVMPGDNISLEVSLITPIAMESTMRFAIREGGRTVGAGRVGEILD